MSKYNKTNKFILILLSPIRSTFRFIKYDVIDFIAKLVAHTFGILLGVVKWVSIIGKKENKK